MAFGVDFGRLLDSFDRFRSFSIVFDRFRSISIDFDRFRLISADFGRFFPFEADTIGLEDADAIWVPNRDIAVRLASPAVAGRPQKRRVHRVFGPFLARRPWASSLR